jgi:hypothetical protein
VPLKSSHMFAQSYMDQALMVESPPAPSESSSTANDSAAGFVRVCRAAAAGRPIAAGFGPVSLAWGSRPLPRAGGIAYAHCLRLVLSVARRSVGLNEGRARAWLGARMPFLRQPSQVLQRAFHAAMLTDSPAREAHL